MFIDKLFKFSQLNFENLVCTQMLIVIYALLNSGGMNGSIVYELERFENTGLKGPLKVSFC